MGSPWGFLGVLGGPWGPGKIFPPVLVHRFNGRHSSTHLNHTLGGGVRNFLKPKSKSIWSPLFFPFFFCCFPYFFRVALGGKLFSFFFVLLGPGGKIDLSG